MKIGSIGAGAMGCIYGMYLSAKNEVLLVDVVKAHVDAINEKGLSFTHLDGVTKNYKIKATLDTAGCEPAELVILLTKGYQSAQALEANSSLIGPETLVLSLQNGYGNADEIVKYVPEDRILLGTSGGGAIVAGPGDIRHKGQGPTHIGSLSGDHEKAKLVVKLMQDCGVPDVVFEENVKALVWSKVFVNIGINAICALIGDTNQCIANNPYANAASYALVKEAVAIANATGMDFDFESEFKNTVDIALVTGGNICSMLADVNNKRRTEVDRINGAAVSEGAKVGMAAPLNQLMVDLIHAKEQLY